MENNKQKIILDFISELKQSIKEEVGSLDEYTKSKWQVVDCAKNVFGANYNFTNFPEGSHEGAVGVFKPTLHQLTSFNHEVRNFATVTNLDVEEKNGTKYIVLKMKINGASA